MDIRRIKPEYSDQLYAHKSDILYERAGFLGRYQLPKFTQRDTDYLNRPKYLNEIESVIKNLQNKNKN